MNTHYSIIQEKEKESMPFLHFICRPSKGNDIIGRTVLRYLSETFDDCGIVALSEMEIYQNGELIQLRLALAC